MACVQTDQNGEINLSIFIKIHKLSVLAIRKNKYPLAHVKIAKLLDSSFDTIEDVISHRKGIIKINT